MNISESDYQAVGQLLGRKPRGLQEIAVRDRETNPVVIRVAPLVDDKPFPTLFWLVDKRLSYALDQLEAGGFIAQLQTRVDESEDYQARLVDDHQAYIRLRQSYISDAERLRVETLGFSKVFEQRGIGGIADFGRIRCLHTYYAAHLVRANLVGELVDKHWRSSGVVFPHLT